MKNMHRVHAGCRALAVLLAGWASLISSQAEGTIDALNKHAWSENAGWINWSPSQGGAIVKIAERYLSGFIWGENIGWIKLGADSGGPYANSGENDYGVNLAADGTLSGYAWSETCGWINFNPSHADTSINLSTGVFDGYAWAENLGWIHFDGSQGGLYRLQTTEGIFLGSLITIR